MSKTCINIASIINELQNNNIFKLLNTQLMAAIIGASVTILGVWITIKHERNMRLKERRDEIKPAISIKFIGLSDEIEQSQKSDLKNVATNVYSYQFSPIFDDFATFGLTPISGYNPLIGNYLTDGRRASILVDVHVDGNFPVTDIKMTNIEVSEKDTPEFIDSDRPISIGMSLKYKNSMFDFYRKHNPSNFSRSDKIHMPINIVDSRNYDKYISPNENMIIKIPMRIGSTPLKQLIKLIKYDKEFMKEENMLDYNIPFDDPKYLNLFLFNLSSFPVQITLSFEYKDIEDNIYNKNIQCFAYLSIEYVPEIKDYIITPSMTTKGYIDGQLDKKELEDYIYSQFDNTFFNIRYYLENINERILTEEDKTNFFSKLSPGKTDEELESIYNEIHNVAKLNEKDLIKKEIETYKKFLESQEKKDNLSKQKKDELLARIGKIKTLDELDFFIYK